MLSMVVLAELLAQALERRTVTVVVFCSRILTARPRSTSVTPRIPRRETSSGQAFVGSGDGFAATRVVWPSGDKVAVRTVGTKVGQLVATVGALVGLLVVGSSVGLLLQGAAVVIANWASVDALAFPG